MIKFPSNYAWEKKMSGTNQKWEKTCSRRVSREVFLFPACDAENCEALSVLEKTFRNKQRVANYSERTLHLRSHLHWIKRGNRRDLLMWIIYELLWKVFISTEAKRTLGEIFNSFPSFHSYNYTQSVIFHPGFLGYCSRVLFIYSVFAWRQITFSGMK